MGGLDKSGINFEGKRKFPASSLQFRLGQPVDGYCADRLADSAVLCRQRVTTGWYGGLALGLCGRQMQNH